MTEMQDPNFTKYLEYFRRLPSARIYYYAVGRIEKGVTATRLSKQMHRSIQTVTNALRDLERKGLLVSEKKGRERIYRLKDPRLFRGLINQIQAQPVRRASSIGPLSEGVLKENLTKWLSYLADMMEGTLYLDQAFKTHVLDAKVDYVIENKHGQHFIMIFHMIDLIDLEATIGRLFSLVTAKDILPNLNILLIVGLVYKDEFLNPVYEGLRKLTQTTDKFEVASNIIVQRVQAGDLIRPDLSEKISLEVAERMPYFSDEALPGEEWAFDISQRRWHAMKVFQNKQNPKAVETYIVHRIFPFPEKMHRLLPRDEELRRWLDPERLLVSNGLKKGDVLIDMGCYEGLFTIAAATIVGSEGRVYGIDLSSSSIEKIESYADKNDLRNIILKEDFPEKVQLGGKIADLVFFGTTLSDAYDPVKSLKNAHDMLKDSGKLVVLEWKEGDLDAGPSHYGKLSKRKITAYIESAGFTIKTVIDEGKYHYSVVAVKKRRMKLPT